MRDFATTDPRTAGRAADVGSICVYVSGGVGLPLYKYAAPSTSWCSLPDGSGAEPVTSDPRIDGLARGVGARALYVSGGVGLVLFKYGPTNTEWCAISATPVGEAPGSFSLPTSRSLIMTRRLTLTGSQRAALAGTARLRIT